MRYKSDEVEVLLKCTVCGGSENEIIYAGLTDVTFHTGTDAWTMYRCNQCASVYLNPRPNEQCIYKSYKNYHTHIGSDLSGNKSKSFIKNIRKSFSNGYRNWFFKIAKKPANKIGIIITLLFPAIKEALEAEGRNLSKFKEIGLKILDVGFGGGNFLRLSKEMGWCSYGVDTDPVTVKNALNEGLNVKLGGIEAFNEHLEFFDAITISHVIEHVHDPKLLLLQARRLLKPGGLIWIETPNIESKGHKDFAQHWRGLEVPRHLTIFNWLSLESLLSEAGFSKTKRHPRKWLYYSMSLASLKIKFGDYRKIPYYLRFKYGIKELLVNVKGGGDSNESEFITIIAIK